MGSFYDPEESILAWCNKHISAIQLFNIRHHVNLWVSKLGVYFSHQKVRGL